MIVHFLLPLSPIAHRQSYTANILRGDDHSMMVGQSPSLKMSMNMHIISDVHYIKPSYNRLCVPPTKLFRDNVSTSPSASRRPLPMDTTRCVDVCLCSPRHPLTTSSRVFPIQQKPASMARVALTEIQSRALRTSLLGGVIHC